MKDHPRRKFRLLIPVIILAVLAVLSLAVMGLWNGVAVPVLGMKSVTYWQALGLLVLSRILFGGLPGRRGGFGPPWRRRFMERWQSLPPEDREKWREEMRHRFGDWPRPPWSDKPSEGAKGVE
ncbi:MAG: hypothetical protein ACREFX_14350 [Opitutaceae bacterium]